MYTEQELALVLGAVQYVTVHSCGSPRKSVLMGNQGGIAREEHSHTVIIIVLRQHVLVEINKCN